MKNNSYNKNQIYCTKSKYYLGLNDQSVGDINSAGVGNTRVLETVGVHHVSRLGGELNGSASGGSLALHHEAVVISD
jgi:hypothetical protein